jgi:hypothetical protein
VNTKEYLSLGKDGYTAFLGAKVLRSGEEAPIIPTTLRMHLLTLDVLNVIGGGGGGSGGSGDDDINARSAMGFMKAGPRRIYIDMGDTVTSQSIILSTNHMRVFRP